MFSYPDFTSLSVVVEVVAVVSLAAAPSFGPVHADHLQTLRSVVSTLWRGLWTLATTSPWLVVVLVVPVAALVVGWTRVSVRRR